MQNSDQVNDIVSPISQATIAKLATALAKAQGEFPVIPKDSLVKVKDRQGTLLYEYKYADLTTIISHTRPCMSKHGLSFTQGMVPGGFATFIFHESGESYRTGFIPCEIPKGLDMKQVAGLVTYVKRISLTAALGVSADEDVDAGPIEGASGNTTTKSAITKKSNDPAGNQPQGKPPATTPLGPTPPMLKRLYAIGKSMGWHPDSIRVYSLSKVKKTPGKLSKAQYDKLCEVLETLPYDDMQAAEIESMYEKFNDEEKALVYEGKPNAEG